MTKPVVIRRVVCIKTVVRGLCVIASGSEIRTVRRVFAGGLNVWAAWIDFPAPMTLSHSG